MKKVANLIPYFLEGNITFFFLQIRSDDAPIRPGLLGLFGGHLNDGELPFQGLKREILEELSFRVSRHTSFLGEFQDEIPTHKYVFLLEVKKDFYKNIILKEGKGFLVISEEEILNQKNISPLELEILKQASLYIKTPHNEIDMYRN